MAVLWIFLILVINQQNFIDVQLAGVSATVCVGEILVYEVSEQPILEPWQ